MNEVVHAGRDSAMGSCQKVGFFQINMYENQYSNRGEWNGALSLSNLVHNIALVNMVSVTITDSSHAI